MSDAPVLPDYDAACTSNVLAALTGEWEGNADWVPPEVEGARQVVLLVLDGLGWDQLQERRAHMPVLASMSGGPITTVCPTTTATALTSITTGLSPAEHGVVGYRIAMNREILNVLRWTTARGDARDVILPEFVQPHDGFFGQYPPVVTRAEFASTGFTEAHLRSSRLVGWRMPSTLAAEAVRLVREGEPLVYVYYDGIDKVAHEYGLGEAYNVELAATDVLVGYLAEHLPNGAVLAVVADHGQVDVGANTIKPHGSLLQLVSHQSGEGRFRWLHARSGRAVELARVAAERYGDVAWVVTREQTLDEGWFGPNMSVEVQARLGDVALVARDDVAFEDPADTGPFVLQSRHGSMTAAEVLVPFLVARG